MLVWLEGVQQITAHGLNTCPCADLFKPDLNDPFRDRALCSYGLCLCILMLWFSSHQTSKKLHVDWEDHAKLCETLKWIEDDDDDDAEFTLRAEGIRQITSNSKACFQLEKNKQSLHFLLCFLLSFFFLMYVFLFFHFLMIDEFDWHSVMAPKWHLRPLSPMRHPSRAKMHNG